MFRLPKFARQIEMRAGASMAYNLFLAKALPHGINHASP
jgi:hypothetical protein